MVEGEELRFDYGKENGEMGAVFAGFFGCFMRGEEDGGWFGHRLGWWAPTLAINPMELLAGNLVHAHTMAHPKAKTQRRNVQFHDPVHALYAHTSHQLLQVLV